MYLILYVVYLYAIVYFCETNKYMAIAIIAVIIFNFQGHISLDTNVAYTG